MSKQTPSSGGAPRQDAADRSEGRQDRRGQAYEGDGPGKVGLTSDRQPDLVAPGGVNQRDHGVADDKPMAGGPVNLDDDDELHPRGNTARTQGTWEAQGGDSGELGKPPGPGLSDHNGPSDPDARKAPAKPRS